tara:strand:+ start:2019 stop:2807 length:789 start_codon:yes stop_codon:yes gene_type:complete
MAIGAVGLAGKLLPFLVKAGSAAKLPTLLRSAGVVGGGLPSLLRGDVGGALVGGALGGVTAGSLGGLTKGAQLAGARGVMKGIGMAGGAPLQVQGALTNLARTVAPIGIGLTAGRVGGGIGGGAAGNVGSAALGLAGYGGIGNEGLGGSAVPPGMGPYGNIGPTGYPLDVLNPLGQDAGRRLRTVKDAETLRDATNIVLPTVRKFSEQAKRDDFSRNMASEAIKKNIQLNAELTKAMQTAGLQMGTTAAQQAGDALTSKYTY